MSVLLDAVREYFAAKDDMRKASKMSTLDAATPRFVAAELALRTLAERGSA